MRSGGEPDLEIFVHGEARNRIRSVGDIANPEPRYFARTQARDRSAGDHDTSGFRLEQTKNRVHQGRFSRPVRADHYHDLVRFNSDRHAFEDIGLQGVAGDKILDRKDCGSSHARAPLRPREASISFGSRRMTEGGPSAITAPSAMAIT